MNIFNNVQRLSAAWLVAASLIVCACHKDNNGAAPAQPRDTVFVRGADVSWTTEMEAAGRKFYNTLGVQQDPIAILKDMGLNTIRLRVWVNPAGNWNGQADVVAKALRAKAQGMRLLIDFHYSDTWADPGHQAKPAAWAGQNLAALKTSVANHTTAVLNALKASGVTPEWVQVGNETNDGMLWPEGKASTNMANFAQLVNAGYDAVKSVFPSAKVIVHVSNGYDNSLFRWMFDGLKNNGARWDVIGMSLYPSNTDWAVKDTQCLNNMNDMVARYNKEVMIVETGLGWDKPFVAKAFLTDLIQKTRSVSGNKGLGVIYWEPEAYANWQNYSKGAFDNDGRPTNALDAFTN